MLGEMPGVFVLYMVATVFIAWWYSRGERTHGHRRVGLALTMRDTVYSLVSYAWSGIGSSFGPALVLCFPDASCRRAVVDSQGVAPLQSSANEPGRTAKADEDHDEAHAARRAGGGPQDRVGHGRTEPEKTQGPPATAGSLISGVRAGEEIERTR